MDDWVEAENFWLARTAILHQLSAKRSTDAERLFRYCSVRSADKEFFIRKAIGWALREYSKTDERAVRSFVEDNAELSPLSRTEALKWLERRASRSALHT
jgi:3-methyladenine DNA glycosylase AlkD